MIKNFIRNLLCIGLCFVNSGLCDLGKGRDVYSVPVTDS